MKIVYLTDEGINICTPTGDISLEEVIKRDIPTGIAYALIEDHNILPIDRAFRSSWILYIDKVIEDFPKAKIISHDIRRKLRDTEMAPWDIKSTIPAYFTEAEAQRVIIRDKYSRMQEDIDSATNTIELRTILGL